MTPSFVVRDICCMSQPLVTQVGLANLPKPHEAPSYTPSICLSRQHKRTKPKSLFWSRRQLQKETGKQRYPQGIGIHMPESNTLMCVDFCVIIVTTYILLCSIIRSTYPVTSGIFLYKRVSVAAEDSSGRAQHLLVNFKSYPSFYNNK